MKVLAGGVWLLLLLALLSTGACYWYYQDRAHRLAGAAVACNICDELAREIIQARQSPQRAQMAAKSLDDMGGTIEKAAATAQIQRDRILRIDPQPGKRLSKTDYIEQGTEVELVNVTLRQLVEFLCNIASNDEQLNVETLRLRTPHNSSVASNEELWMADVVLTQRVYAPTTPR
jgi:hypothetical protein